MGCTTLASNEGWGSVGIDHDTAQFAVATIRRWCREMGVLRLPKAAKLMIPPMGVGTAETALRRLRELGRKPKSTIAGLALSSWHDQVEQNRISPVLLHNQELAQPSTGQLQDARQSYRQYHERNGSKSAARARYLL